MNTSEYRQTLDTLPYGKRLPGAVYLIDLGEDLAVPSLLRITVAELRKRLEIGPEFNLLKFHTASPKISFLAYPDFEKDPHPALRESIIVDLVTGKTRRDDYRGRANPPILHRKETFLPPEHPLYGKFSKLTRQEEVAGLLDDTARIGFRINWERILGEKGLGFKGHRLIEIAAAIPLLPAAPKKKIHRHKTALVRREISKPVKTLLELGQLRHGESFFDYGCGHGGDVEAVGKLGHDSWGWDPVHAPEVEKQAADVVNLGFILNVIEDPAERVEALLEAWKLTRRALLVSTLIAGQEAYDDVRRFGDGVLTSRDTFQKFFEPSEIQALIEDSLHTEAVPVGLGIYLVFRDTADLHDFLAQRSRRFIDWESLSRKLGLLRALKAKRDPYDTRVTCVIESGSLDFLEEAAHAFPSGGVSLVLVVHQLTKQDPAVTAHVVKWNLSLFEKTDEKRPRHSQVIRCGLRSKCLILGEHDDGPAFPDRAEHMDQKFKHRLWQLQLLSTRADQRGTALSEDLRQQAIHLLEVLRSKFARIESVLGEFHRNRISSRPE